MTNAPTTRETADHIGEANEKVTADHAELAALISDLRGVWLTRIIQNKAADALEALLSEIAALRGERDQAVGLLRRYRFDLPSEALEDLTDAFLASQGDHR